MKTLKDAIKEVATPIEERKFTNIHNRIKNIRGLKRKESDFIASIDPDILGDVIKALKPMFEDIEERSALVANQTNIIDVVLKDLHALLLKQMSKGKLELMNNVARMVGLKVTTKGQGKNKAFLYDLEKGFRKSNPRGSSRGKR